MREPAVATISLSDVRDIAVASDGAFDKIQPEEMAQLIGKGALQIAEVAARRWVRDTNNQHADDISVVTVSLAQ